MNEELGKAFSKGSLTFSIHDPAYPYTAVVINQRSMKWSGTLPPTEQEISVMGKMPKVKLPANLDLFPGSSEQ